ncbi:MAG: hypothetical protein HGA95_02915 [Caldiserica bacterium]|nr:hypothetical protein [Caldisericota bacterium]
MKRIVFFLLGVWLLFLGYAQFNLFIMLEPEMFQSLFVTVISLIGTCVAAALFLVAAIWSFMEAFF